MNFEGLTWAGALRKAWTDPELKQLYFTAPLSLGERRHVGHPSGGASASAGGTGGSSGGGGKGGGGGGSSGGGAGGSGGAGGGGGSSKGSNAGGANPKPKTQTLDGRELCFAWNKDRKNCNGSCGRVHACQICLKEGHPMCEHRKGGLPGGKPRTGGKRKRQQSTKGGGKADE